MTVLHKFDASSAQIVPQFQALVGDSQVVSLDDCETALRQQINRAIAPPSVPTCVVYPNTIDELAEVVTCAHRNRWPLLTCGHGSKLHWGGLAEPVAAVVSTTRLDRLIDHAVGDLTVTAEAGMTLAALQSHLESENQLIGLDPSFADRATLGGVVATGDTGSMRQRYGGVRDRVIGISFIRADGHRVKAGGRVVKNVAGYDLMKLMTGAYGTLGIISQLSLRVYPMPPAAQSLVLTGDADSMATVAVQVLRSTLTPTHLDILSPRLTQALGLGQGYSLVARFQTLPASVETQLRQLQQMGETAGLTAQVVPSAEDDALLRRLRQPMEAGPLEVPITCKMGVEPNQAIATLEQLPSRLPAGAIAHLHLSSGLGQLRFDGQGLAPQSILRLRQWCHDHGGFLTVLEAPASWKRQIDPWGYPGDSLAIMERIKHQFDPDRILNPGRFVGGI